MNNIGSGKALVRFEFGWSSLKVVTQVRGYRERRPRGVRDRTWRRCRCNSLRGWWAMRIEGDL